MQNKVIVLGDDTHNTLGLIRSLGEGGISPYFININTDKWGFVESSKYINKAWRVNSPEEGLVILRKEFRDEPVKPVIICTSDPAISIIDYNYNELKEGFLLPTAAGKQGEINRLMNKNIMRKYAKEAGFDMIKNLSISPTAYAEDDLLSINYPCLVKPTNSLDGTKQDIRKCKNKYELKLTLKELAYHNHSVEIQDYIVKDIELLIMGVILGSGEVIVPLFLGKKREDPKLEGNTAYSICTKIFPGFDISKVNRFFELVQYRGIFSMEFLVKGDRIYFLEVNMRNDGNGYAPTFGGVNLPLMWVKDCVGEDISHYPKMIERDFNAQIENTDFSYLKRNPEKFFSWVNDSIRVECHMIWNKKDVAPFWAFLMSKIRKRL